MRHPKLPEILAKLRAEMERHYGDRLVQVILFGSQARGDAEEGSDIDVLIVLRGDVDFSSESEATISIIAGISLEYTAVLSCLFLSEESYLSQASPLLVNVHAEGMLV